MLPSLNREGTGEGLRQPTEHQRWQVVGHDDHSSHADDGDLGQRTQSRMLGQYECADADEHQRGRKHHTTAIAAQPTAACGIFIDQSFGYKDGVVVTLSEDKGGQDDIDDIELDAQQLHQSQYPNPAYGQRQERQQGQLNGAKREP